MSRTRHLPYVAVLTAISSAMVSQFAAAHGYMDYPPARQEVCDRDGGYWDSTSGSTIPNAACRAAFKESGWYPFVQKPEFAKLVSNFNSQAAVEAAIPDGTLCAAADPKKAGIDIPSSEWQTTPIDPAANGKLTLLYRASTPHNPSMWKIYLSNAGYNSATDALAWSDLDLIAEFDNVPAVVINEKKYYQMQVTLPTDRTGNAVLYSRWQRDDPAGEGFYNCSDLSFGGDVIAPTWSSIGGFVKSTTDATQGDTVWFRVFDGNGSEAVFEKLAIDAKNDVESVWAKQIADTVNASSSSAKIGKIDQNGVVAWDNTDLYGNLVFVKNKDASFQLEVKKLVSNTPPVISSPSAVNVDSGQSVSISISATDAENDAITFTASAGTLTANGNTATVSYIAPSTTSNLVEKIIVSATDGNAASQVTITVNVKGSGPIGQSDWDSSKVYVAGDTVLHLGTNYTAQWWNKGEEPGTSAVWAAESGANQGWSKSLAYSGGDTVEYKGKSYKAKWWTKGDLPTNGGPWGEVK
ncbi:lytic polysaccharide monooxygenase [Enterovibrio sp. ZSDZ42]|uniref:Lytic polysaccharide monooxygenase n=1 Tax=Enterovibrio gelatinilyticus TaxID=2899819 RepID=A0ABT5QWX6_9GAMM|nr:lytic polysaccharide monooxygenase [Enterovibrio sp. ZSDZ42]MDD1792504.1 lytic polysaccharide monooxygenase [Enterovibrio sp. ZSDZ42]